MPWTVRSTDGDREREFDTRKAAENAMAEMEALGVDVELIPPKSTDGGVAQTSPAEPVAETTPDTVDVGGNEQALHQLGDSVNTDPLDILPGYMIDEVQGTPTLNKRGISVLAYHYGVTVVDRETPVGPHESEWEFAIVETTVANADGNTFVGTGTAHVDRGDEKEILLELAETRSYKRAVSFATGTGIVSYQEMVSDLE